MGTSNTILTAQPTGAQQEETRQFLSEVDVRTSRTYVGKADYEENLPEDAVYVTVGIFFDGTWNNRNNTEARLEHEKRENGEQFNANLADRYREDENSFDNYYSNVARLEPFYDEENALGHRQLTVYMEGIGTEDYKKDTKLGGGLGKGKAGVRPKVIKGCEKIGESLGRIGVSEVDLLVIDAFGFSRGAAAARNFVHEVSQKEGDIKQVISRGRGQTTIIRYETDNGALGEALAEQGIEVKIMVVRFVGLYDTVASYGVFHGNDTRELHLDAIRKARHTFQLAAADEHRVNFRLTNIASAGGKGVEKTLPGVHSDIGGGYNDNTDEERFLHRNSLIPRLEADRQYLVEQGWYDTEELTIDTTWGHLNGTRRGLSNRYGDIPLHIMAEYGMEKRVIFNMPNMMESHPIEPGLLTRVKERLDNYIKGEAGPMSLDNPEDRELLLSLRHNYLHFSAYYSKWLPGPASAMRPNWVNGQRQRVIQNG